MNRTKRAFCKRNPTFCSHEKYLEQLPALIELSDKYRRIANKLGVSGDDVKSRMLLKYERSWKRIPVSKGQRTYIHTIFRSCINEELKYKYRAEISLPVDKPFDHNVIQRLACVTGQTAFDSVDFSSAAESFQLLESEFGFAASAFREHHVEGATLKSLAEKYKCVPNTLRRGFKKVAAEFRMRFPQFGELVGYENSNENKPSV